MPAEKPVGNDQVNVAVAVNVESRYFQAQRIIVENSEGTAERAAAQLELDSVKIAIFRAAKAPRCCEVGLMIAIQIG